jgi:hypothetical protein
MKKTLITLSISAVCCLASAQHDYYPPTYSAQNNTTPTYYTYAPTYYPQQGYVPPGSAPPPDPYSSTPTTAPEKRFGAGITLGEPVGADVKYWLNDTMALDGAAGFSTHRHSSLYLHADVLWHKFDLFDISPAPGKLPLYFGVGALVRFRDHGEKDVLGVRVPIGVSYMFDNVPIDVFVELGPALDVHPTFKGELTGGIGARFWF